MERGDSQAHKRRERGATHAGSGSAAIFNKQKSRKKVTKKSIWDLALQLYFLYSCFLIVLSFAHGH
jgi:hypothetical protein